MYGIDNTTSVASMPAISAAGTAGFFTGGSPAAGLPATLLEADWLNMVQTELLNVVGGANLKPDKGNLSQILQAIKALIGDGAGLGISLSNPGYVTLPGGFIIQFGTASTGESGFQKIDFPVKFPTSGVLGFAGELAGAGTWASNQPSLYSIYSGLTTEAMTVYGVRWDPASGAPSTGT